MDNGEGAITTHLIRTGHFAQLSGLLRQRLTAAGWYDKVQALAAQELSTSSTPAAPDVGAKVEEKALGKFYFYCHKILRICG